MPIMAFHSPDAGRLAPLMSGIGCRIGDMLVSPGPRRDANLNPAWIDAGHAPIGARMPFARPIMSRTGLIMAVFDLDPGRCGD
jgi:hypothetical protein